MSNNKKTTTRRSNGLPVNKISFYMICITAVLYLVALILHFVGVNSSIVSVLRSIASAIMIILIAICAWRYVANKPTVWKVLYIVCLLVVIVGIIIPLVF